MLRRDLAQELKIARLRRHHAHVPRHRFHDHGRDLRAALGKKGADRSHVVVRGDESLLGVAGGNAPRVRDGEGGQPGTGGREQTVHVPVVAAIELDYQVPSREAAGQADGAHGGFGA